MLRLAGPIAALLMLSACAIYPDDPVVYGTPAYPAPYPYPPGGPVVIAPVPPPAMIVETPPPMPVIGSVWVGGYWGWGGGRYSWRPGYWQPRPHGAWTPGYWRPYGGGWAYRQGYWHGGPGRPGRWR